MTSPDFREYVDLTIFDKQPRDIYQEAIDYAVTALPELSVRAGTLEDALFQAMSFVSGEVIASINRLPNGLMEGILKLLGFARIEATYATGTVSFTMVDDVGGTIPAGTQVGYTETVEGVSTFHTFTTSSSVTIPEGNTVSAAVAVVADTAGIKPSLLSGQSMVVVSASNRILSAALASDLISGEAQENDTQYFSRGATYLGSLSAALVTASQIQDYILINYVDVHRCKVYDLTQLIEISPTLLNRATNTVTATVPSGHGIVSGDEIRIYGAVPTSFNGLFSVATAGGTSITWSQTASNASTTAHGTLQRFNSLNASVSPEAPGSLTIFVCGEDGADIASATKTEILSDVASRSTAGLNLKMTEPIIVPITISVTMKTRTSFSTLVTNNDVEAYLANLLSPNGWDWSNRIRVTQMIARVAQITGVDYVSSLTFTIGAGYSEFATIDANGDVKFSYKGTLPLATVSVSEII